MVKRIAEEVATMSDVSSGDDKEQNEESGVLHTEIRQGQIFSDTDDEHSEYSESDVWADMWGAAIYRPKGKLYRTFRVGRQWKK